MKQITLLFILFFVARTGRAQDQVLWKMSTGGGIHGAPALSGNAVYVGSNDMHLYAMDKTSGKPIWKFRSGGAIKSDPAIAGNKVIFASADGNIYAVGKDKGDLLWTFRTNGEQTYDLWDYYHSSPVAHENMIYAGSGDSSVYAIDAHSGKMVWRFKTGGVVHASPVVRDGRIFIGSYDGYFYTIDAKSGSLVWKFKTLGDPAFPKGEVQRAAWVDDETVIFGSRDFYIYALDAKTGAVKWNMKEKGSWVIATPAIHHGNLYVGTSDTHQFYGMDARTGKINWVLPLNMRVYATALIIGHTLVFGCFNGKVYFVEPGSGKVKGTFQTTQSKQNYAQVYDPTDHIRKDFDMYGDNYLRAESQILSLGSILSGPVAEGNTLYFGDASGFFYALKMPAL